MKNKNSLAAIILLFVFSVPSIVFAQSDKQLVREGNKEFVNGQFNEAEINYRKALDKNPNNGTAQFNLGDAMYSQENYEKAAEVFEKTNMKGKSATERSDVYYNYGNALLKAGKGAEAAASYMQALRENPKNENARYNLEYLRQKKQEQQNQDQNKDDKKDQDQEDQEKKEQDKQDQEKQENEQDQEKEDKQEQNKDQEGEKNEDQQQNGENQKPEQGEQNEQQAQKISKKDAERMLEALKNNEKKTLENLKKAKKQNAKVIKSEKDW